MVRLKGSTLPESLVAMTVLVTCFAVTFLVIGILMDSGKSILRFRAKAACENIAQTTKTSGIFIDEKIDSLDFSIDKKFIPYPENKDLIIFSLEVLPKGSQRIIYSRKEIIRID